MHTAVKKTTAFVASAAVIGFSSLFMATPANAAPTTCADKGATTLSGNICELRFTLAGTYTFTPSADMGQLEVLLVAGGGNGRTSQDYAAGGGGEVKVVGFGSGVSTPMSLTVGGTGSNSTAAQGTVTALARAGGSGGSGIAGASGTLKNPLPGGLSGGGAGASPVDGFSGGAGVTVASVAPSDSLFSTDTTCYGGGGAFGIHGGIIGSATCGGGSVVDGPTDVTLVAPTANSGGGGAAGGTSPQGASGAGGLVVLRWIPVEVTTTFVNNGHGTAVPAQTFDRGGKPTPPPVLAEPGYVFNGWFSNLELTTPADFTIPVLTSTTFYASWTVVAPVTVTFVNNGHGDSVDPQTFAPGGKVTPPANLTATGFVFNGWFANDGLTTPADFTAPITASTKFYASWTAVPVAPVKVDFKNNGHGDSVDSQSFAPGGKVTPPANLTATGFIFHGWFADSDLKTPADFTVPITTSTTFYASWTAVQPVTVTITFSDGHGGVITQTIPVGGKLTKPADPTMAGFTFNGWFTDTALTVPADFSAPFSAATTLYASWTAVRTPVVTPEKPGVTPAKPVVTPGTPSADTLASTGAGVDPAAVPFGLAALGLGAGLLALRARRSRKTN